MIELPSKKLIHIKNVVECKVIDRINRFVVKIAINNTEYNAYINNTGRLNELILPGNKGFCTENPDGYKTSYRLFAVSTNKYAALIDTYLQMKAFEYCVEHNYIPWLERCYIKRRNIRLAESIIDYLISCEKGDVYLEVKSAALKIGDSASYPDCPSLRGRRHIRDLIEHYKQGGKAAILFIAAIPNVDRFRPNIQADIEIYKLLKTAVDLGIEIKAINIYYNPEDSTVYLDNPDLPIDIS